eukprot:Sdes_comp19670_c0_seq1m11526
MNQGNDKGAIVTKQQLDDIAKNVPQFSRNDLDIIYYRFKEFLPSSSAEKVDRARFRDVLHNFFEVHDSLLMDRVFRFCDKDNDNTLNFNEWVEGLALMLNGSKD